MPTKKKTSNKKKRSTPSNPLRWIYIAGGAVALAVVVAVALWQFGWVGYRGGDEAWVRIPTGSSKEAVGDSLRSSLGDDFGPRVYRLWQWMGGEAATSHGAYQVKRGDAAWRIARAIEKGRQTPINVTFNNVRTMGQLAERISAQLELSPEDFLAACDSVLPPAGFKVEGYPAAFLPDSYQFYWTAKPQKVVSRLLDYRNEFWNDERRELAKHLGLTPVQVATLASIVEEETNKADERPKVARLYLNRLAINMKLQADPTVKFSTGDFSLRRIKGEHLKAGSAYNTYLHTGLPPGPIRVADKTAIDAVLQAPHHSYLYMCAKEDFSGYHNFATDYATHRANAKRYQQALDKRGIQ
ncbi:MAG: endolytic transglycosylase MltG [Bacteroidales bacterium]|nr:endolytic transglycosylase MltG [Bacteroidales bacterium]